MVTMAGGYSGSPASELAKKNATGYWAVHIGQPKEENQNRKNGDWSSKKKRNKKRQTANFCYPRQMTNLPEVNAVQDNNLQRGESKKRGNLHCIFHLIQSA